MLQEVDSTQLPNFSFSEMDTDDLLNKPPTAATVTRKRDTSFEVIRRKG